MKKLFYVVKKHTDIVGDFNGLITIKVYETNNKLFCEIETDTNSPYTIEEEIQEYLDENGYGDETFEFVKL